MPDARPHETSSADTPASGASLLFRHVTADKAALYRAVMETFAAAKRQFRLQLRPDEVLAEGRWPGAASPALEAVQQALTQLADWGNLVAQPDMTRVTAIEDYYRARFVYRLSHGGEAVEEGLAAFARVLSRRAELQSVALEDILSRLNLLSELAQTEPPDAARVHETLRDLATVFAGLADNAQAFMASVARVIDLQRADAGALMNYKNRLIDYLERFIGDLVSRSSRIARQLAELDAQVADLLMLAATREARDAAPGDAIAEAESLDAKLAVWRERWAGLRSWFIAEAGRPAQAELLRGRARAAIPQLLAAIALLNERRGGKSDRSADFRVLARWFAEAPDEADAHRLFRAAFALQPARHLALLTPGDDLPATTPWPQAPPVEINPRLRERGRLTPRGAPPKVADRSRERALLAAQLAEEQTQLDAARARLATGAPQRLSQLGRLDHHEFRLLLSLIGEALAVQASPEQRVSRDSGDGTLRLSWTPLDGEARIETPDGEFSGRDHELTAWPVERG